MKKSYYYILNKGYKLRGWEGLPFGLQYPMPRIVEFFNKKQYACILDFDGETDFSKKKLTKEEKKYFDYLIKTKIIKKLDKPQKLEEYQLYKFYPTVYKSSVQWSITGKCNYKCKHCFMSAPSGKFGEPTFEQIKYTLDEFIKCGIQEVSLTGGEPLVRKDFMKVVSECTKRGIYIDTIYTNGKLVNSKLLDGLKKNGQHPNFHISFDGLGWHDWLRGIKGAEKYAINAFKLCKERGYQTSTSFCLHKNNLARFRESVNFLASIGCSSVKANIASPTGNWATQTEHFLGVKECYEEFFKYIPQYFKDKAPLSIQLDMLFEYNNMSKEWSVPVERFSGKASSKHSFSCGSMRKNMYVSPEGYVLPCMTFAGTDLERKSTSLFDKPLTEILKKNSLYCVLSGLEMGECIEYNKKCRNCKYRYKCGAGCRACACVENKNNFKGIDESACTVFLGGWYDKINKFMKDIIKKYPKYFVNMNKKIKKRRK